MGMTQHSSGTPDPTGGTGAPPTPFAPVPDSRPVDAPWPEMTWPPAAGVVLRGRVVELAPADPARDAAELFAALDHDDVWRHVAGRPRDADDQARLLEQSLAAGRLPWVVRLVAALAGLPAGTVVGTSTYLDVSVADARLEIGSTAYTPAVWGSAVNPETKLLLLGHAFESLGAGRVQLKTDVRNHRSQRRHRPARRDSTRAPCAATSAGPTAPCATPRCSRCWPRTGRRRGPACEQRLDAAASG